MPTSTKRALRKKNPLDLAQQVTDLLMTTDSCTARVAIEVAERLLSYRLNERSGWVETCRQKDLAKSS